MNQVLHSTPALTLGSDYPMQSSDNECIGNINSTHHGFSTDHHLRRDGALAQSPSSYLPLSTTTTTRYIPHRAATHDAQYHAGAGISDSNSGSISTSPSSNASSLVSPFYQTAQTGLSVSTAPFPQHMFASATGHPPSFGSMAGLRHRGTSITDQYSNPAMLPPARSPGMPNPVSPSLGATTRDNYTTATPHLARHALSPRLHTDPFARFPYSSLTDAPRTVLSANMPLSPQTSAHYTAASSLLSYPQTQHDGHETPPFDSQDNLLDLTYEDRTVTPKIDAKIEKGFFMSSDRVWTCYRRNYFSVQCSYTLDPHVPNARLYVSRGGSKPAEQVQALAMSLSAVVDGPNGKMIELIQHTPKRDKGPQLPINKEKLLPTPPGKATAEPHGYPLTSFHNPSNVQSPYLPMQSEPDNSAHSQASQPSPHSTSSYAHTFERIQFKSATANNGKRRAQQQYYHLIVELWADLRRPGDDRPNWVKVCQKMSAAVVVRGRSPSHYSNEGPSSTGTSRQGGGPGGTQGGGHSSFGSSLATSFGRVGGSGLSMLGSSYGSAYRGSGQYSLNPSPIGSHSVSSASSINGSQVEGIPQDHPMEEAEPKAIDNFDGYQYYPSPLYEAGLQGSQERKYKDEHTVAGFASGFSSSSCGRYMGTETSRGYYPDLPTGAY